MEPKQKKLSFQSLAWDYKDGQHLGHHTSHKKGFIYSSGDWHDLTLDILSVSSEVVICLYLTSNGYKQNSTPQLCLPRECFRRNQPNHVYDLHSVKVHLGFVPASLVILLIISPGTGMQTTLCPMRTAEQNTEQSLYCVVCGALVCGTSLWSSSCLGAWELELRMMDQERISSVYYDWNPEWKKKNRRLVQSQ